MAHVSSRSRTRERITWRVTPAGRATRPHVLARSVYQGATGDRRMLVFAGLPAARQRDRGGGEGWPRERERDGAERGTGSGDRANFDEEGRGRRVRESGESDEGERRDRQDIPVRRKDEKGREERDRGEGRIYRLVGGTERDGGGVEGLERVWGLTGTRGRKHRGEGGKNEVTVERDTREHRGGWKRGSARRGKSCGWRSGNRGRRSVSPHEASPGPDDDGPGRCDGATAPKDLRPSSSRRSPLSFPFLPLLPPRARHLPHRPAHPSAHDRSEVRRYVR